MGKSLDICLAYGLRVMNVKTRSKQVKLTIEKLFYIRYTFLFSIVLTITMFCVNCFLRMELFKWKYYRELDLWKDVTHALQHTIDHVYLLLIDG